LWGDLNPPEVAVSTLGGLPAHALLVHAVVVLVPLTAVLLVLVALWPAARNRLNLFTAALSALALVSVPLTTSAGDWLEHHVPRTPLVRVHTHLGDTMLPWAIGLFLLAGAIALREHLRTRATISNPVLVDGPGAASATPSITKADGFGGRTATLALAVLAIVVAVGSIITVYRIGDSGARAAWTGQFSEQANPPQHIPPPNKG
jgi:hypothetical protein